MRSIRAFIYLVPFRSWKTTINAIHLDRNIVRSTYQPPKSSVIANCESGSQKPLTRLIAVALVSMPTALAQMQNQYVAVESYTWRL